MARQVRSRSQVQWFALLMLALALLAGTQPARAAEAEWDLRDSNTAGGANVSFGYGSNLCIGVTGDWDGNGTTTIGTACQKDGSNSWEWNLRDYNSAGGITVARFPYGSKNCTPLSGDWDGNGTTTIGVACPPSEGNSWQ